MKIGNYRLFQFIERGWRPFQQWGFAIVCVCYAGRPLFGLSFEVETFAALAAASGVGFIGRGVEKTVKAFAPQENSGQPD